MIIDLILDRRDAEEFGEFEYNARDFYFDLLGYGRIGDAITRAMDAGTEDDVRDALCAYVIRNEYNPMICDYIRARVWLENTRKVLPRVSIGRD